MADFDTAADIQRAFAIRCLVAHHHVADIGHHGRFRQIAAKVDAREVELGLVGADHKVAHGIHRQIGDHGDIAGDTDRAKEARRAVKARADFFFGGKAEFAHAGHFAHFTSFSE